MKKIDKKRKAILILCNIILVLAVLISAGLYSRHLYTLQEETKKAEFTRTIELMKQVSQNYLENERGYVKDWSAYISERNMTLEEAMDFLRSVNTNTERFIHLVDMDSFEAYSSYYPSGQDKIDTYSSYKDSDGEYEKFFVGIMTSMFEGTDEEFEVLGKYRLPETRAMGVGVGTKVTIVSDAGTKNYLMLRVIPVDVLKRTWVFPTDYSSAEVGIITRGGDYVVQSNTMRSQNFLEYIRGYNFQDNYNAVDELYQQLENTDSGILEYKNYRGTDCVWYYSSFGHDSALDILGVIDASSLKASVDAWYIILLVCGTLVVLAVIDGIYLLSMNHRLRETARLSEQSNRAKTQFLSAMSHDIRTPLNAVLGMMMLAHKRADDPEYVRTCMDKGMHSGKQLLTLINDVLDISKIESGKLSLNPEKICLDTIISELLEMLDQSIAQKEIRLESNFEPLPYKYLYADKMRLNQIYVNLLTNAVKYTQDGGKILLHIYEEEILSDPDHVKLIFCVKDTGIGMTEDFQKHMYSAFSREINTQVNRTQGTGLGLSIVKQMVDLMGGTIVCRSLPGVGTEFTVSMELPVIVDEELALSQEPSQGMEQVHLLVAEDNDLNWEIFRELVSDIGVTCERAANGRECIDMLTNATPGTYAAILMDIHMPVLNGYEATTVIRAMTDENINKIPIIAMTADAFAEDVRACLECGMNGHIAKPIDMDKLTEYLKKIQKGKGNI